MLHSVSLSESLIDRLIELDYQLGEQAWSKAQWLSYERRHIVYYTERGDRLLGFALVEIGDDLDLLKIVTDEAHRGVGIAGEVLGKIKEDFPSQNVFLEVKESNLIAQNFYSKHGFEKLNSIKNFYRSGETALRMMRRA